MDRELIVRYSNRSETAGLLKTYQAKGRCEEPECGDVLEYTINTKREIITEIGFDITKTACLPMKACAQAVSELAKDKPVLEAYLIDADIIAKSVGGLDKENIHCAMMAELALKHTIIDYSKKKQKIL